MTSKVILNPGVAFVFEVKRRPSVIRARYTPGGRGSNPDDASVSFQVRLKSAALPRNIAQSRTLV